MSVRPVMFFNHPRLATQEFYWKTPPHQDWRSMQGSLDSVVVWVALVDVDAALGALEVVPGSASPWPAGGALRERVRADVGVRATMTSSAPRCAQGDACSSRASSFTAPGPTAPTRSAGRRSSGTTTSPIPTFVDRGYPHSFIYRSVDELITPDFPRREDVERVFG